MKSGDVSDSVNKMPAATIGAGRIAKTYQRTPTRHLTSRTNSSRYPARPSTRPVNNKPAMLGPASMTRTAARNFPSACQFVLTSESRPDHQQEAAPRERERQDVGTRLADAF